MIFTTEYLLALLIGIMILFAVGAAIMHTALEQAKTPKVSIDMIKMLVVRKTTGLYFEFIIQSHTTDKFCINYIDFKDLSTGYTVTIGDHDPNEASNLPVCIDPSVTFTLGGYQGLDTGFMPGNKVMIVIHYSAGSPNTVYQSNDPNTILFFTTISD